MNDVSDFKHWIYHEDGMQKYGMSPYGFASKIENDNEFCELVARDYMKAKNIDESELPKCVQWLGIGALISPNYVGRVFDPVHAPPLLSFLA